MLAINFLIQFADSDTPREITLYSDCKEAVGWLINSLELDGQLRVLKHWIQA